MGAIASQITSLTIVYSNVYSDADQRKHKSSASLAFVWGIHRGPVNSPHQWPVTRKMSPFDDVIMDKVGRLLQSLRVRYEIALLWLAGLTICWTYVTDENFHRHWRSPCTALTAGKYIWGVGLLCKFNVHCQFCSSHCCDITRLNSTWAVLLTWVNFNINKDK